MATKGTPIDPVRKWLLGFLSGFLATLFFHQVTLAVLWEIGLVP